MLVRPLAMTTVALALAFTPGPPAFAAPRAATAAPRAATVTLAHRDRAPGGLFPADPKHGTGAFVLEHTDVHARVAGNLARVEVTQRFKNPFKQALEAIYVFPLPDEAAVDEMELRIGKRVIKGLIKRRDEARKIYEEARRAGRTAGLLEQERDNVFTQAIANIRPGETIEVTIRYAESLAFEGGDYEFVFPMVVGPRYIPGTPTGPGGTDQVPDAARISPPVLRPGTRSGHDIRVEVAIEGPLAGAIASTSHGIRVHDGGRGKVVTLAPGDRIPNKDLILRYRVAGPATRTEVLSEADPRGGHFGLYLVPALHVPPRAVLPKDVVFLMDTSGSQSGAPLAQSQALMRRFLAGLNADDTFTVIDFANVATRLSDKPLANTAANRKRALAYVDALQANGGTELMNGIDAVLKFPPAGQGRLRSVVLLTDAYIGNEKVVIATVQQRLPRGTRLYSFGVGSSVNRFLLDRLAEVGRGTMRVVRADEDITPVCEKFFRQINDPVLMDIKVTWEGEGASPLVYPAAPPDLFAAQPLVVFGRKADAKAGVIRVEGTMAGGAAFSERVPVRFDRAGHPAIATLWARARLKGLQDAMFGGETKEGVAAATATALDYHLMSPYTAFVAVSEEVRVDPQGRAVTVDVPVELPEGVSYEGIFGKDQDEADQKSVGRLNTGGYAAAPPPKPHPLRIQAPPTEQREPAPVSRPAAPPRVSVVSAAGLDAAAIVALTRHLAMVKLTPGTSGRAIYALTLVRGKVTALVRDPKASTLTDAGAIAALERALRAWTAPAGTTGTVALTLDVAP